VTSGVERVFCAGANIRMLGRSSHPFKVNFCKFTNETRLSLEDLAKNSGVKTIAPSTDRARAAATSSRSPATRST
jgi:benzoyl-CoA-dihydrodiol lyase